MSFKRFFLVGILACASQLAFGQANSSDDYLITPPPSKPLEFLLVLRTDDKMVILDPETHDMESFESSVDTRWVQSIEMLTGEDGYSKYGPKGKNGVIVIQFKPNYVLPLGLPEAVKDGE